MKIEWLDNIHDQCAVLFEDACYLKDLASAFRKTGNTKTSDELEAISENMLTAQREISANIGQMLSDKVNAGNKGTANVLKAMLFKTRES